MTAGEDKVRTPRRVAQMVPDGSDAGWGPPDDTERQRVTDALAFSATNEQPEADLQRDLRPKAT